MDDGNGCEREIAHADPALSSFAFSFLSQGTDLLAQAKASADKAISDKNFRATATDAKVSTPFPSRLHLSTRRFQPGCELDELTPFPLPPSFFSFAQDKTVSATDGLAADASATTQAATSEGSASLDQAKTYLAGVASTVGVSSLPVVLYFVQSIRAELSLFFLFQAKAAELAHTLDDKTKTADHPGVVSQLFVQLLLALTFLFLFFR